jgi:predicted TIM-barrel fold metal-dependent hydrolase
MHVELVVPPTTKPNSKPNSKMFPVLVFLLMACYGIMALVVVEQGHVIQSQRNLIQQLVQDSHQLTAFKVQAAAQQAIEKKQANANANAKGKRGVSRVAPMQKEQGQKLQSRKSRLEKQPLQADDKIDRRRYPAQI